MLLPNKKRLSEFSRTSEIPLLVGSPPGLTPVQAASSAEAFTEWLKHWLVQTKINIGVVGSRGVGKSFLANTLLESTFEDRPSGTRRSCLFDTDDEVDTTPQYGVSDDDYKQRSCRIDRDVWSFRHRS